MVVVFTAEGGFDSEAVVSESNGSAAGDSDLLHTAAVNWRTKRKYLQEQVDSEV